MKDKELAVGRGLSEEQLCSVMAAELLQTSLQCWMRKGQPTLQDSTEGLCTILSLMMMCPMCEHEQEQLLHEWRLQKLTSTVNYPTVEIQGFTGDTHTHMGLKVSLPRSLKLPLLQTQLKWFQ